MDQLDKYKFSTKEGFNGILIKLRYEYLRSFYKGTSCLELGCADGEGTKMLIDDFKKIVAVDGSKKLIDLAKKEIKDPKVTFIHSYFEELKLDEKFDVILLLHILEHVDNPVKVLQYAKKYLKKEGILIADVPNAMSIHRQVGVMMGMLKSEYELNSADLSIGHQRIYDMNLFKDDMKKAGLKVIKEGGIFQKPFSNSQMDTLLDKKGIYAFNEIGKKYPDIAAEIFVICKL